MYDKDPISSQQTDEMPCASTAALTTHDVAAEPTFISLHQLRCAVVELSTALNEALRHQRGNAAACLQRAQAILQAVDDTPPQLSKFNTPRGLAPWQVRRVMVHIEANLSESIRNRDLAAVARVSTFHFNVAFRNSVGHPPHEYVIQRRIERAQGLMLSTDTPLSEIAIECGFADQAHFTRQFRTVAGETPAAWRRARANPRLSQSEGTTGSNVRALASPGRFSNATA